MATPDLSETEKAYLAGIIDGEGCIQAHYKDKLSLRLEIGNTDWALIAWLTDKLGGKTLSLARPPNKTLHLWRLGSIDAVPVLEAVVPYMIIKKRQASLFIELAAESHRGVRGRRTTETERARRLALVTAIRDDKRKVA